MYMKTNACTPYTVFSSRENHAHTCAHDTQGKTGEGPGRASSVFSRRQKHSTSHTEKSKRLLDILYPSRLRLKFELALSNFWDGLGRWLSEQNACWASLRAWVCIPRSNIKPAPKVAHNCNPRATTGRERRWRWGSWVNLMYAVAKQANKNKIMTTTKTRPCLYQCGRQILVTDMVRYLPHGCCGNTCSHTHT